MLPSLHKNAATTPLMRQAIREAEGTVDELAARFGQSRDTIMKWRRRESAADRSHTPHRLRKTLNDGQEALVLYLRTTLRLPLDDLLAVTRQFIAPQMSRSAERFLKALHEAAPFKIHTILTDNAKAFTDRFPANGQRQPTGTHSFYQGCTEFGIEHRLIPPGRPQTNGMVERFNGRIAEVLRTPQFRSRDDLETTLKRCVWLYNQHLPQKAISHSTPIPTMKDWQAHKPEIFKKAVRNHPDLTTRCAPQQ